MGPRLTFPSNPPLSVEKTNHYPPIFFGAYSRLKLEICSMNLPFSIRWLLRYPGTNCGKFCWLDSICLFANMQDDLLLLSVYAHPDSLRVP